MQKKSKKEKVNITIKFYILEVVWANFGLNRCTKLTQKGFNQISAETDNFYFLNQICLSWVFTGYNELNEHHQWILQIRINLGTEPRLIRLNTQFTFFRINSKRGILLVEKWKNKHHHWIDIPINLSHFRNILGLFDVLPNFLFTKSEKKHGY